MPKKITLVLALLLGVLTLGMSSCQKKIDIDKIKEYSEIENPSSAQIDEMIDMFEVIAKTPAKELEKMSEDDQLEVVGFVFKLAIVSAADTSMSEEQSARIKKLMDEFSKNNTPAVE